MVKSKTSKNKGKRKPQQQPQRQPRPKTQPHSARMAGLDAAAIAHIKLMADPCNAPLVYPAYEFPGGGAIIRYRRIVTCGTSTGETAGGLCWAPGVNEFWNNGGAAINSTFIPNRGTMFNPLSTATTSGQTTLNSFRCIGACARMITNASESNRSGLVFVGNADTTLAWGSNANTGSMTAELLASSLPISTRSPAKFAEVIWIPGHADTEFNSDDTASFTSSSSTSRSCLSFAFTGAPPAAGYTFECTAVYEVKFGMSSGVISTVSPPTSSSSWNVVLRGLDKFIRSSPVLIDGVSRASDYVKNAGVQYLGQIGTRAAVGLLM